MTARSNLMRTIFLTIVPATAAIALAAYWIGTYRLITQVHGTVGESMLFFKAAKGKIEFVRISPWWEINRWVAGRFASVPGVDDPEILSVEGFTTRTHWRGLGCTYANGEHVSHEFTVTARTRFTSAFSPVPVGSTVRNKGRFTLVVIPLWLLMASIGAIPCARICAVARWRRREMHAVHDGLRDPSAKQFRGGDAGPRAEEPLRQGKPTGSSSR